MVSPARWFAWLVCISLLFVGCRDAPATQLLVVLDSDIPIGSALQRVQIVVTDRTGREVVSQQEFAVFRTQRAAGVTLFSDPVKVPAGTVKFAAGDKTLLYFLDPDGVILELAEYR